MKKLLLCLVLILSISLVGCNPEDNDNVDQVGTSYTEEELLELIEGLIPEANVETTYDLLSFQSAIVGMLDEAKSGVVGIVSTTLSGTGSGSGVIYKQVGDTYYLVTNEHVVDGTTELTIVYEKNGLLFEINDEDIELLGKDATTDLAVLTFDSDEVFNVIPMADSYSLEIGEFVFAIGNPLGFDYYGTVTMGVISGLARYVVNGDFNATRRCN